MATKAFLNVKSRDKFQSEIYNKWLMIVIRLKHFGLSFCKPQLPKLQCQIVSVLGCSNVSMHWGFGQTSESNWAKRVFYNGYNAPSFDN